LFAQVNEKWWMDSKEGHDSLDKRMEEMISQIRYIPQEHIVLVGHSHFFREMFKDSLHPSFQNTNATLFDDLQNVVIQNCGVAALSIEFDSDPKYIRHVELLFGSQMNKKH
jgi:broad specificity phosphatase PhoE